MPHSLDAALDSELTSKLKRYEFQGNHFQVTRGDYGPILQKVVEHLEKAKVGLAGDWWRGALKTPLGSKDGWSKADQSPFHL